MVTDGFDDERENVDELWESTCVNMLSIVYSKTSVCMTNNKIFFVLIMLKFQRGNIEDFDMDVCISYCDGPGDIRIKLHS